MVMMSWAGVRATTIDDGERRERERQKKKQKIKLKTPSK